MRRIDYTNALNARVNIEKRTIPATGVDNIALPVTAANTGMKAQMFGQSAENLVVNGDFRNGTTGWLSKNLTTTSTANGVLLTKVDPDAAAIIRSLSTDFKNISAIGDKIYTMARIRCNSTPSDNVYLAQANNAGYVSTNYSKLVANTTDWQIVSLVGELDRTGNYLYIGLSLYETYTGTVDFDYMEVINLTETFGAGNEPTKEQCDKLFANYFEGTANTIGTGRIRSVDADGENASILQLTTPPLRSNGLIKDEIRKGTNGYELVKRVGVGTLGSELFSNGQDWVDTDGDGLADEVTIFTAGTQIREIRTGGIFSGNYQYIEVLTQGYVDITFYTPEPLITGKRYRLRFRYSASAYISVRVGTTGSGYGMPSATIGENILYDNIVTSNGTLNRIILTISSSAPVGSYFAIKEFTFKEVDESEGIGSGFDYIDLNSSILYTLATPVITPIAHAGLLNSNSNGTVYFEPTIKDIITYTDKAEISDTDYPISSIESIEKNGIAVNPATAVIAEGGLSLTHPDLEANDEVELIYFYNRESTGRGMRLLFYNKA